MALPFKSPSTSVSRVLPFTGTNFPSTTVASLPGELRLSTGAAAGSSAAWFSPCSSSSSLVWPSASGSSRLSMNTTMMVMSSVRVSFCSQRRYDSATMAAQASCGSLCLATMSTTAWLDRNSKTPSLAMTKNGCWLVSSMISTSGTAITPICSATVSPMLLVKAVPGYMPLATQRRGGSPSSSSSPPQHCTSGFFNPSSWSSVRTLAPQSRTLAHSSVRNGVWSLERSTAKSFLPRLSATTALESPTLAT
ncbi:hypothetical protein Mapa_013196 [Marchantia paleacea]|nr:hypothetical protein Mapa_013196 [Marchantia paleacea]